MTCSTSLISSAVVRFDGSGCTWQKYKIKAPCLLEVQRNNAILCHTKRFYVCVCSACISHVLRKMAAAACGNSLTSNTTASIGGTCRPHSADNTPSDSRASTISSETGKSGTLQRKIRQSVISKRERPRLSEVKFASSSHESSVSSSHNRATSEGKQETADEGHAGSSRKMHAASNLMLQAFIPRSGYGSQKKCTPKMRSERQLSAFLLVCVCATFLNRLIRARQAFALYFTEPSQV